MAYEVKTEVFEGPFELLISLVNQRHVDVTRVNIAGIVDDFLAEAEAGGSPDLDAASGFLLMAAMLLQIKARFLLADRSLSDLEEELALLDERDRLLARLLAFLTFEDMAAVFGRRMAGMSRFRGRTAGIDRETAARAVPALPPGVTPAALAAVYEALAEAGDAPGAEAELEVDHLDFDLPSVGDAMEEIKARMTAELESTFSRLVSHCSRRVEVAAYFLAVLELARWGVLSVAQEHPSEIEVRRRGGGAPAPAAAPAGGYGRGA